MANRISVVIAMLSKCNGSVNGNNDVMLAKAGIQPLRATWIPAGVYPRENGERE
jgi:hypothetical protein